MIPPNGWWILILSNLLVLVLTAAVYWFARRWSTRASFSLFGLFIFLVFAVGVALTDPRRAILITWPVLIGSAAWIVAVAISRDGRQWPIDAGALLAAIPTILYLLPLVPALFMSDGTKSVAITAGVRVIILGIILPAVDGLFVRPVFQSKESLAI